MKTKNVIKCSEDEQETEKRSNKKKYMVKDHIHAMKSSSRLNIKHITIFNLNFSKMR